MAPSRVILAVEYAPARHRGFYGSFAHIGVPGGLLLASGAFSVASLMPDDAGAQGGLPHPLRDLLAAQPKRLLLGMGPRYIEGFTFNFFSVYLLAYVVTNLALPKSLALNGILLGAAIGIAWCR